MACTAGIDVGAATTKALIFSEAEKILGKGVVKTGADIEGAAREAYRLALSAAGLAEVDIAYVAATGYGRYAVPFRDGQMTELTAHARGAAFLFPQSHSVLDMGSQNTRAIRIEPSGRVKNFRVNDKCAAGAGSFLVRTARYLELQTEQLGPLALKSQDPVAISSVCAVLAESEIINHVSAGKALEDIVRGAMIATVSRAVPLLRRLGIEPEVTLTGGTGLNPGMVAALEEKLEMHVNVDGENGLFAGALGASLLALMRVKKLRQGAEARAAM